MRTRSFYSVALDERELFAAYVGDRVAFGKLQACDGGTGPKYAARVFAIPGGRFKARPLDGEVRKLLEGLRLVVDRRDQETLRDGCRVQITGYSRVVNSVVFVRVHHDADCKHA
jgi:hypothetical protein